VLIRRGVSTLGEEFIDIEARSASGFVEARLQDGVLEVSYMQGPDVIFLLAAINRELGPETISVIRGYATDRLSERIIKADYLSRFAKLLSARLGENWSGEIVKKGAKQWLVFTKARTSLTAEPVP